jgi:hypothetical protein
MDELVGLVGTPELLQVIVAHELGALIRQNARRLVITTLELVGVRFYGPPVAFFIAIILHI